MKFSMILIASLLMCQFALAQDEISTDLEELPEMGSMESRVVETEDTVSAPAAAPQRAVVETEAINVEGFMKEEAPKDQELESIHTEIQKQKKEIVLNKIKAKKFQELSKSTEQLSTATEEYLEERKAAQQQIAEYNLKVKCMSEENPGQECAKYKRRR